MCLLWGQERPRLPESPFRVPPALSKKEQEDIRRQIATGVVRLAAVVKQREESGDAPPESYRAADFLAKIGCREAMPFLLGHITHKDSPSLSSGEDVVTYSHPCLRALVCDFGATGVEAIISHAANGDEAVLTDYHIDLLSYGILMHCGFDQEGREFAARWIDHVEKRERRTGALNRLRKQIVRTEYHYR
jgi:hypothetical protein